MFAQVTGTRLEFVAVPIKEPVKRFVHLMKGKNFVDAAGNKRTRYERSKEQVEEPGGWMVYFPRGHVLRIRTKKELAHYGLDRPPKMINLQGLNDPNSPLGKLMAAQDEDSRRGAMQSLEDQVIRLATAKTGNNLLTKVEQEAA